MIRNFSSRRYWTFWGSTRRLESHPLVSIFSLPCTKTEIAILNTFFFRLSHQLYLHVKEEVNWVLIRVAWGSRYKWQDQTPLRVIQLLLTRPTRTPPKALSDKCSWVATCLKNTNHSRWSWLGAWVATCPIIQPGSAGILLRPVELFRLESFSRPVAKSFPVPQFRFCTRNNISSATSLGLERSSE